MGMGENCCLYGFLSTLGCIGLFTQSTIRQKIRERYGIEGTFVNDLLCYCCCPLCSLVQEANEIKAHGAHLVRWQWHAHSCKQRTDLSIPSIHSPHFNTFYNAKSFISVRLFALPAFITTFNSLI